MKELGTIVQLNTQTKPYLALLAAGCYYEAFNCQGLVGKRVLAEVNYYEAPVTVPLDNDWISVHGTVSKFEEYEK